MSTVKNATARSRRPIVTDDYLDLVKRFPLRPLRSHAELQQAGEILDEMIGRPDLTVGQRDYLAALVRFVSDFERQTIRRRWRKLRPVELLKHLLRENGMSTSDLGKLLGSRGLASEVLSGRRGLSKAHIVKLARRFRVEPGLFLGACIAA